MRLISAFLFSLFFVIQQTAADPLAIGEQLQVLALTDLEDRFVTLEDLSYDRALVIVFGSIICPASVKYNIHQAQIYNQYGPKGVRLVVVNANFNETNAAIKTYYQNNPAPFPLYRDPNNRLADRLGATHTPQAFLLDHNKTLHYRGEIDNGWGVSENTTSRGLWDALDTLLAGQPISRTDVPSFGCEIRRVPKAATNVTEATPTFHRDILPILQAQCQTCHRPGGLGRVPFYDCPGPASSRYFATYASAGHRNESYRHLSRWHKRAACLGQTVGF